ncbi:MAG: M10 family metallopeptidase C-terminal domain-containing protein, partial [Mariniblastus sp.]
NNEESHQTVLYDSGGIDTLNFTNHIADEIIDLREGQFTTVNGIPLSVRIQYGTVIENARGGAGNDSIRGNETPNLLFGNAGNDILRGGGDNDISRGGAGDDTYIWSLGDGRDIIREEANGGIDSVEFYDPSGSIDSLEDDFVFRRFGDNLRIDLTLDQGEGQGTFSIVDFANTESQVELMRFHGLLGAQIGDDIDLTSIFDSATANAQRFTVTDQLGQNGGFIAVPV